MSLGVVKLTVGVELLIWSVELEPYREGVCPPTDLWHPNPPTGP